MGMFDYLQFEGHQYQTKDTPKQGCDNYKIENGELWYEDYDAKWVDDEVGHQWLGGCIETFNHRWIRCDDFNGKMRFYRAALEDKHESWKQDAWIEYNAIFKNGMLIHLRQVKEMKKVIRDGKVAVLVSPDYGAGWYSWHGMEELVYHPKIVELVLNHQQKEITKGFIAELLGIIDEDDMPHLGGAQNLVVKWLPVGTEFIIDEYDGAESITLKETLQWLTA